MKPKTIDDYLLSDDVINKGRLMRIRTLHLQHVHDDVHGRGVGDDDASDESRMLLLHCSMRPRVVDDVEWTAF
jgi:hypothetical protein